MGTQLAQRAKSICETSSKYRVWRSLGSAVLGTVWYLAALPAHALSGSEVAHNVNARYNDTRAYCYIDKPAHFCTGLIVRPLEGGVAEHFWAPTPGESAAQSMSFVYLRRDVDVGRLPYSAGFILSDSLTASEQGKPMNVRCVYPLDEAVSGGSGDHGCNLGGGKMAAAVATVAPDLNSCDANGVTDVASWMTHHAANGWQCSFSADVAAKFYTALQAHKAYADKTRTPSLLIEPWTIDAPRSIPFEAIYFDVSNGGQLVQAQQYQMIYYKATGEWLPILRMAFDAAGKASFEFVQEDQLNAGFTVADDLNARFNETRSECPDGKAIVYCSGVIVRATNGGPAVWNPSADAIAKNGVSSSYLRTDAHVHNPYRGMGLVFRPLDAPATYPLTPRCIYAPDGNLHKREDGCGPSTLGPETGPCAAIGIDTLAKWLPHYAQYGAEGCSFAITVAAVNLSLEARRTFPWPPPNFESRNELVLVPWPRDIPGSLPLEALFYSEREFSLPSVQATQLEYYLITGRFLPIVHLGWPIPITGPIFIYHPEDQATPRGAAGLNVPSAPFVREGNGDDPVEPNDSGAVTALSHP
ncbi:hypothetical protein PAQ31011_04412 [Pandoraea aquatica]|uniref:Uncharacterized protein n=1 Tax=Pandoraea aquatica TaxID=2508290 RepID=A0A5E4YAF0_9BURK|nr:hypothetical protein [Pandoraea aquatica]VVE45666.1 hypothetical protein PAQ31011_04412 [Pandoraea aquatica]